MKVRIKDIEYFLPESVITNEDLNKDNENWDMRLVQERAGVISRHIAKADQTALDLAAKACERLFTKKENNKRYIDGIIFCTQSPDYIMPPNSCILHKILDLPDSVFALDVNLACSGYIYGLAIAQGLVCSGISKNILLVNADTYSKYINKDDRSVRVLFGDAAAVSWITKSDSLRGIVDIHCATAGKYYDKFIIPAGGCRMPKSKKTSMKHVDSSGNKRTLENIYMDGMGILGFVNSKVPRQVTQILRKNRLKVSDVDLFVFHQASKLALDSFVRLLNVDPDKVFRNLSTIGNTVSASIPIALKDAVDKGRLSIGDKVVISGFGAGLSWGTAIINW